MERFKEAWVKLGISNDLFIRTTDDNHGRAAQAFFRKVMDAGFIYKADYEGWYCLPDEKFLLDSEVVDGNARIAVGLWNGSRNRIISLRCRPFRSNWNSI